MGKISIFVEGSGEAIFVWNLAKEILEGRDATLVTWFENGGKRFKRVPMGEEQLVLGSGKGIYIQIVNSSSEGRVVSDALERADTLRDANFDKVVLVRDVAPNYSRDEIGKLRSGIEKSLDGYPIPCFLVLEIMEFEAWLLSMADHYLTVDARMDEEAIVAEVGRMPTCENCQDFDRPSEEFRTILALAGITETKSKATVSSVLDAFDFAVLINERSHHIPDLKKLIDCIDLA